MRNTTRTTSEIFVTNVRTKSARGEIIERKRVCDSHGLGVCSYLSLTKVLVLMVFSANAEKTLHELKNNNNLIINKRQ